MARSSSSSSGRRSSSSYPSSGASACDRSRAAAQPFFPRCSLMTDEKKVRRPAFARPAAPPPLSPRGAAQQSAALGARYREPKRRLSYALWFCACVRERARCNFPLLVRWRGRSPRGLGFSVFAFLSLALLFSLDGRTAEPLGRP